jgi:zinc transport system substrate-binding protein
VNHIIFCLWTVLLLWSSHSRAQGKPVVVVSVEPVALIVKELCGEQCEVITLVPRGVSEHSWQPGPKDIIRVKSADAAIAVGLGLDDRWFKKLGIAPKKLLWLGPKLEPMGWWSDDMSLSHPHQGKASSQHSHDGHHHERLAQDPHVWTDAGRMARAAVFSADHMAVLIPVAAEGLKKRGALVQERLVKLQIQVQARRQTWRVRPVVVFHDVIGYFARRFDLPVLAVSTGSGGHDFSAKMIAEGARRFKDSQIASVMVEREDGTAKNLARELKTTVKQVDFAAARPYPNWDQWYLHIVQSWEDVLKPTVEGR